MLIKVTLYMMKIIKKLKILKEWEDKDLVH
jgi:hypothetical protein